MANLTYKNNRVKKVNQLINAIADKLKIEMSLVNKRPENDDPYGITQMYKRAIAIKQKRLEKLNHELKSL